MANVIGPVSHVVLDRDGTLIKHIPYLCDPAQVHLLPGVAAGIGRLIDAGCKLFLHTNQSGIGRGYFSMDEAVACNQEMLRQLHRYADVFERICIAPEAPDRTAQYRKPSPLFGLELIADFGLAPQQLCYVGDNLTDMQTANNIGCRAVGVDTGVGNLLASLRDSQWGAEIQVFNTFTEAVSHLLDFDC